MGREMKKLKDLDVGSFVIVNEEPCRITKKSSSSADEKGKVKVYVEGLFDGQKRTFVESPENEVDSPIISYGNAEILAIIGDRAQIMDLSDYETYEVNIPLELRGDLNEGDEIKYIEALDRRKIQSLPG